MLEQPFLFVFKPRDISNIAVYLLVLLFCIWEVLGLNFSGDWLFLLTFVYVRARTCVCVRVRARARVCVCGGGYLQSL